VAERAWERLRLPEVEDGNVWELFHHNSRVSPVDPFLPNQAVLEHVQALWESLPYPIAPRFELPRELVPLPVSLLDAILARRSARAMRPVTISRRELATILHCGYGVTRTNEGTVWPRPFRTVPSGGALYPLEIYFHTAFVEDLPPGLYHYNPSRNDVALLREGDLTPQVAEAMVFSHVARQVSLLLFITAVMERSTFKYVAQNVNLACVGLELGSIDIGGFYDRRMDDLLGLDGLTHSTIYAVGVGKQIDDPEAEGILD
jgi:SagB-type dehydrogenase family enzyme